MAQITIVGLGPGDAGLLTREAWALLESAQALYLRTAIHPTVAALPARLELRSFDALYERAGDFGQVYDQIVDELIARAEAGEPVLYAVPGHPLVAEATTRRLLAQARESGIAVTSPFFDEKTPWQFATNPHRSGKFARMPYRQRRAWASRCCSSA